MRNKAGNGQGAARDKATNWLKAVDFLPVWSVHATGLSRELNPATTRSPSRHAGGARGGDGAKLRRTTREVQTMTRSRSRAGSRKRSTGSPGRIRRGKTSRPNSSPTRPQASVRPSKRGTILALLKRPRGAAISELTAATGWQSHSVRAVLTGLRKEGRELLRDKDDAGATRYRVTERG